MEKRITFWLDKETEKMKSIEEVESGQRACNCKCPNCWADLVAKKGEINIHHFAHASWVECVWAYESTMHKLAKEIMAEEKQIRLPGQWNRFDYKKGKKKRFDTIELELYMFGIKPDAIGSKKDEIFLIEFAKTHFADFEKIDKIRQQQIECIEIDIGKCPMNKEKLKRFLLDDDSDRKWIYQKPQSSIGPRVVVNPPEVNYLKLENTETLRKEIRWDFYGYYIRHYKKCYYIRELPWYVDNGQKNLWEIWKIVDWSIEYQDNKPFYLKIELY